MPLRSQLAADKQDGEQAAAAETTTADAEETRDEPRRRRWGLFRRRAKSTETQPEQPPADDDEVTPAPRTPVGKAKRTAKPTVEPESSDESAEEATDAAGAEDVILVPHKPAGKRLQLAAAVAAVLFVAATAFAGAMVQPYLADRALVETKLDVARTARDAITTLWTYTPDNMESLPDRASRYLGGDFANEYRKYIDAIVAPNKQAQVTNTTEVMGAAVETIGPKEATALVYTNSVATSPVTKNIPSLRYLSYRLTMVRHADAWLITKMSTVTSFDLTPQL
jgi:Mce-associated membrane protein